MNENLYPKIEIDEKIEKDFEQYKPKQIDQSYRLREISEIKAKLQNEIEQRKKFRKAKKRLFNLFEGMNIGLNTISLALGITGIALLSTIVTTPLCITLEGIALGSGALAAIFSILNNKAIIKKLEKHDKIQAIAISKLNTISELVSKSLEDGKVDPVEFKIITDEYEKYYILKNQIRKQTLDEIREHKIDVEAIKKDFLEMGKKLGRQELLEKLK